jgi:hypothetical protein
VTTKHPPSPSGLIGRRPRLASLSTDAAQQLHMSTIHSTSQLAGEEAFITWLRHASPAPNSRSGRQIDRTIIPMTNSVS